MGKCLMSSHPKSFWRSSIGCLVAVLAAMVGLAGCGSSSTSSGGADKAFVASAANDSAWSSVVAQTQPSGQMSVANALSAFALSIGPVPGAVIPPGPKGPVISGTIAIDGVLANWAHLTAPQQQAILQDLGANQPTTAQTTVQANIGAGPVPSRTSLDAYLAGGTAPNPNIGCPTANSAGSASYVAQVNSIKQDLLDDIPGSKLPNPVYVEINTTNVLPPDDALMYTYGCSGSNPATPGEHITSCTIHVEPTPAAAASADTLHDGFIHEMTHCLLYGTFGTAYDAMPAWYLEGIPEWVGSELGGGDSSARDWWNVYLKSPSVSTFIRTYSANGFYTQLKWQGTDVWKDIIPMGNAFMASGDSNVAGWNALAPSSTFLSKWGSGFAQGRYSGSAWTAMSSTLPESPQSVGSPADVDNGGSVNVNDPVTAAAEIQPIFIRADVVQVVNASAGAVGRISLGNGEDATLADAEGVNYCAKAGGCKCPAGEGTANDITFTPIVAGLQYATVSGGLNPASVTVTGSSL
jgi:hypothetical protein